MLSLTDYLIESLILEASETKFEYFESTFKDLIQKRPDLSAAQFEDFFTEYFDKVMQKANMDIEEVFIYAPKEKWFKIPYSFLQAIVEVSKSYENLKLTFKGSKKCEVRIESNNKYIKIFETGSGSIGRVNTSTQEQATCVVYNAYVDAMKSNGEFNVDDKAFIKELLKDLFTGFDSGWLKTFGSQCTHISNYLTSIGCNPLDYRLTRYDDGKVGKAYKEFVQSYTRTLEGQKDNFDPSDVLVYKESAADDIVGILKSYNVTIDNYKECKTDYINDLWNTKLLQGISLKKLSPKSSRYDLFNVGGVNRIEKVNSFEVKTTPTQVTVVCTGKFDLHNLTDGEGDPLNKENSIKVVMRSFGGGQTAVDCTLEKGPSLGKCPARFWRKLINTKPNDDLTVHVEKFADWLSNNNENIVKNGLADIIKYSIKEGGDCFPFILIH